MGSGKSNCSWCNWSRVDLSACRAGKANRPTLRCMGHITGKDIQLAVSKDKVCDAFKMGTVMKLVTWKKPS